MIVDINGYLIDISQISWISSIHGIREHSWFKFCVNGKEFEWEAQYRDQVVDAVKEYHEYFMLPIRSVDNDKVSDQ